jgi:hypothetical protein
MYIISKNECHSLSQYRVIWLRTSFANLWVLTGVGRICIRYSVGYEYGYINDNGAIRKRIRWRYSWNFENVDDLNYYIIDVRSKSSRCFYRFFAVSHEEKISETPFRFTRVWLNDGTTFKLGRVFIGLYYHWFHGKHAYSVLLISKFSLFFFVF